MPTLIKPSRVFSDELLQTYRQQGDSSADAVITSIVEAEGPTGLRSLMHWLANPNDIAISGQPQTVQDFFSQYAHLPTWADPVKMKRGMVFFKKHANQIGLTLGFFSLPYSYLGANGAQVLWLTERIKNDTSRRLQETGEWVFAVNNPKEWLTGRAIRKTLKVRLIHAGARWFSLHSNRWTMEWGHPINQEDMAGTNLTFSYVVLMGLRKLGIQATEQEEEDYLHHINVVDYLNGVAEELLPKNLREAYMLGQAIAKRQFAPSEAGIGLTRSLLDAVARQLGSANPETARNLAAGEMRFFLGDHYADWLGIPNVPVEKRLAGLFGRLPIFSAQLSSL
ncbi:oxygenase MpaB family protein [Spirosoma validum]|uniref:DUF2236 domain-containing protein n=1 Tax=Spirosoma validum TaxID=2771355 RepID=A0A927AZ70_9BACT|nr:oxygenase MpaB family protein [Spirosoma validum]MBD2752474.1 DUF2236 domain-containing protein [Spirosoma validum]